MSSTNRGALREVSDYYKTPEKHIINFLDNWYKDDSSLISQTLRVLDPCAGGVIDREGMSYPLALAYFCRMQNTSLYDIHTVDIRADSPARVKCDYLARKCPEGSYDLVITNPPFCLALPIIQKAFKDSSRYIVMLLRLNFFGTKTRKLWWQNNMPEFTYVHSERISFTGGQTDSIEYMHCVWNKLWHEKYTKLRII